MKKTVNAGIGGRNFTLDEDAYSRLEGYLKLFRTHLKDVPVEEVMDDLESRIAELFTEKVGSGSRVVDINLVEEVINQLGMPDGSSTRQSAAEPDPKSIHKLYRDTDDVRIAGVCSGLALYFGVDIALVRILMLIALIVGSAGFWVYVILWIAVPKAVTPAQKCELRGLPPTASNLSKFSTYNNGKK